MSESFDVIVVGARCAGAPLATMLARAGLRVCVVDKDRFPSDTLSTHAIQARGVQALERLGVLDDLLKIAPPMVRGRMVFDGDVAVIDDVVAIHGRPGPQRPPDNARRNPPTRRSRGGRRGTNPDCGHRAGRGARPCRRCQRPPWGSCAHHSSSEPTARARQSQRWSEQRSTTRPQTAACSCGPTTRPTPRTARSGSARSATTRTWPRRPTTACASSPHAPRSNAATRCALIARRSMKPGSADGRSCVRGRGGTSRRPIYTMANMRGFFRTSAGPGWALVGDAGHFKDRRPDRGSPMRFANPRS